MPKLIVPPASQNTEDYIKGIYKLQKGGQKVTTSALAKHLGIGDGSVTDMVKKLSQKKLIRYTPYRGVVLTDTGARLALKTVRRHRLWEMFLVQFLGYSWDEIHDEAERLEHSTSDEMERRLDRALGFPKVDPHGDPIPSVKGEVATIEYLSLADSEVGREGSIVRVSDDSPEVLRYMEKLGVVLNKKVKVVDKIQFDGSVIIKMGSHEISLSRQMAQGIFVEAR